MAGETSQELYETELALRDEALLLADQTTGYPADRPSEATIATVACAMLKAAGGLYAVARELAALRESAEVVKS